MRRSQGVGGVETGGYELDRAHWTQSSGSENTPIKGELPSLGKFDSSARWPRVHQFVWLAQHTRALL